jgi:putative phosphoribosyl transferase
MKHLPRVQSPTLLIVGSEDGPTIPLNEEAYEKLTCPKELVIIPGASHLFEEPGALDKVAQLARNWFIKHFLPQA